MKIKDLIQRVNKSKEFEEEVDFEEFCSIFHLDYNYENIEQDRLMSYWIGNWYCTDQTVGYRVYYFDNEVVCLTVQNGRKCGEEFEWISKELYYKVKNYVQEVAVRKDIIPLQDLEAEIGGFYKIEFNGQLYSHHHKIPYLNGEKVSIVSVNRVPGFMEDSMFSSTCKMVRVEFENKETKWVNIRDLDFPFNLVEG